jgi:hypothetical protein
LSSGVWVIVSCAAVAIVLAVFFLTNPSRRGAVRLQKAWVLEDDAYDAGEFKKFKDALDAVSIGCGMQAPSLIVVDTPAPVAYVVDYPSTKEIAVTSQMIALGLTSSEIEAIAAVLLSKTIITTPSNLWKAADDYGLDPMIWNEAHAGYLSTRALLIVEQDTRAVRETGQPAALGSAIRKCVTALDAGKTLIVPSSLYELASLFVEPVSTGIWPKSKKQLRDELICLRLSNLDVIAGKVDPASLAPMMWSTVLAPGGLSRPFRKKEL